MLTQKELRIAAISDIHLGGKRNKTEAIIANLNTYLNTDKFLKGIDLLVLVGDVFDEMLNLSSRDVDLIDLWIAKLLRRCHRLGITVRVLEGTPSHDRGQSRRFLVANEIQKKAGKLDARLKYVDTLSIEHIDELGITVLYVPDEWGPTTQDTLDQVRSLLAEKGLMRVDYAFMHGCFSYQLPAHIPHLPRHNEEAYLSLVQHLIFIGHVHTHTTYERIIAQGSFDRLGHNEEEPKGFVKAVIQKNGDYQLTFIENKGAKIYRTITCAHDDVVANLLHIGQEISDVKDGACIRIAAHHTNAILSNMSVVKERWPLLNWTQIARGKDKEETGVVMDHKNIYVPIAIDRQNLSRIVMERLLPMGLSPQLITQCKQQLSDVIRKAV